LRFCQVSELVAANRPDEAITMLQACPPLLCATLFSPYFNSIRPQKFVRQFEGKPGNDMLAEIYSMLAQLMFTTHRLDEVRVVRSLEVLF
jgi:hypothetical protein